MTHLSFQNGSFVLVELGLTQTSPGRSPTKIYHPLQVVSPDDQQQTDCPETPDLAQLQIDEAKIASAIEVHEITAQGTEVTLPTVNEPPFSATFSVRQIINPGVTDLDLTPTLFNQDAVTEEIVPSSSKIPSPQFSQFLSYSRNQALDPPSPRVVGLDAPEQGQMGIPSNENLENPSANLYANTEPSGLSVTRQEVMLLSTMLGRIPRSFLAGGDEQGTSLPLSIVESPSNFGTALPLTSSQEERNTQSSPGAFMQDSQNPEQLSLRKRQRPRFSLRTHMFHKHPVLKFSVTGPIDPEKTSYKLWCRVCRSELSLMSRGTLELMAHFRCDSHLIKEHRMRIEIPGMALFDKKEQELQGMALIEAKKVAKNTHPNAPQLDSLLLLVGQRSIPDFGSSTSPTEVVLSLIYILEYGLKNGGHLDSLIGIYDGISRLYRNNQLPVQNWDQHRLYVSIMFRFSILHISFIGVIVILLQTK